MNLRTTALVLTIATISSQSIAANLQYTQDNRYTHHTIFGYETPNAAYSNFGSSNWGYEAGASQTSALGTTSFTAEGGSYRSEDAGHYGAYGTSVFDISFSANANSTLNITSNIQGGLGVSNFILYKDGNILSSFSDDEYSQNWDPFTPININLQQNLVSGSIYRIVLNAHAYEEINYYSWQPWMDTKYSLNANLAPSVPVPSSMLLFTSGVTGLAFLRKRLRK